MTALLAEQFPVEEFPTAHLSASAIEDFLLCSARWFGSRVAKWPQEPASAPAAGTAFHAAVEIHHRDVDGDADPETELVQRWKAVKPVIVAEKALGKRVNVDLGRSLEALDLYRARFPRQPGDDSEVFFKVMVPGVPVPIIGYMDLVTKDTLIRDIKTTASTKSWSQKKADTNLQATLYCYATHQMTGFNPPFEFVVLNTGGLVPVSLNVYPTTRTLEDFAAFEELVRDVFARMRLGLLAQTCPPGWCRNPEACELLMIEQRRLAGVPEPIEVGPDPVEEKKEPVLRLSRRIPLTA